MSITDLNSWRQQGLGDASLPNSPQIEVEEVVLGGLLFDPHAMGRVVELLRPEFFVINSHQTIYRTILQLYTLGKPTDLMTVTTWLADHNLLEQVGGQLKLAQLIDSTVSAVNIDFHSQLIIEKYLRRQLIATGREIAKLGLDATVPMADAIASSFAALEKLRMPGHHGSRLICDVLASVLTEIEAANVGAGASYQTRPTGFASLDNLIGGGLYIGSLNIFAARPGVGKSTFAIELALRIHRQSKLPVVFYSLEMSEPQIVKKFLLRESAPELTGNKIFGRNQLRGDDWSVISRSVAALSEATIFINDNPAIKASEIREDLARIRSCYGKIGLVVVDYLQLMAVDESSGGGLRSREIDINLAKLRAIAKEFDTPVLGLAQFNRGVEDCRIPELKHLRESGGFEQEGALIIGGARDVQKNSNSLFELHVLKNRFGACGEASLVFNPEYGQFSEF